MSTTSSSESRSARPAPPEASPRSAPSRGARRHPPGELAHARECVASTLTHLGALADHRRRSSSDSWPSATLAGRVLRTQAETLREPVGIVQGAFFALVGLILAFGLTLALGRYDTRRAAVVDDANTIGTTYLRAQTLAEPMRSRSLQLLRQYTDASLALSHAVPTTAGFDARSPGEDALQRRLWSAGRGRAHRPRHETARRGSTSRP